MLSAPSSYCCQQFLSAPPPLPPLLHHSFLFLAQKKLSYPQTNLGIRRIPKCRTEMQKSLLKFLSKDTVLFRVVTIQRYNIILLGIWLNVWPCGQARKKPEKGIKIRDRGGKQRRASCDIYVEEGKNSIRLPYKKASRMLLLLLFPHPRPQVGGGRLGSTLAFEKPKGNFFFARLSLRRLRPPGGKKNRRKRENKRLHNFMVGCSRGKGGAKRKFVFCSLSLPLQKK